MGIVPSLVMMTASTVSPPGELVLHLEGAGREDVAQYEFERRFTEVTALLLVLEDLLEVLELLGDGEDLFGRLLRLSDAFGHFKSWAETWFVMLFMSDCDWANWVRIDSNMRSVPSESFDPSSARVPPSGFGASRGPGCLAREVRPFADASRGRPRAPS
jgi:hypothetical protein